MDVRQIDCFLAVADHLSFSMAARELFVSTSAVSQQIKALERELGVELFVRTKHSVTLTSAGRTFQRSVRLVRDQLDRAIAETRDAGLEAPQTLGIGIDSWASEPWLPTVVQHFNAVRDGVSIVLIKERLIRLTDLLFKGSLDIICTCPAEFKDMSRIEFLPTSVRGYTLLLPAGHRLAAKDEIMPEDLRGERLLALCSPDDPHKVHPAQFLPQGVGVDFAQAVVSDDFDSMVSMVEIGLGICLIPAFAEGRTFPRNVVNRDVDFVHPDFVFGLAWLKDNQNRLIADFVRTLTAEIHPRLLVPENVTDLVRRNNLWRRQSLE